MWIITIAIHYFALEMTFIMLQLTLYVSKLCVKLVILLFFAFCSNSFDIFFHIL